MIESLARVYADVNKYKPKGYSEYNDLEITYQSCDNYSIIKRIGRGKYSEVFLGIEDSTNKNIVIKVLKPVAEMKIKRELKILSNLRGCQNIITLLNVVMEPISETPSFIFEYIENENFKDLYKNFTKTDIRYYLRQLLLALDCCHSMGIMHRDVKPQNIVINNRTKTLRLIDWGLADFYHPGQKYNVRVASRYFKGPELLVNFEMYDYSLDLWAVGCVLAGMIFRKDTMFQGKDNVDQLLKIVKTLGSTSFEVYLRKYQIKLNLKEPNLKKKHPVKPWSKFVDNENQHLACQDSFYLLDNLLQFDHQTRLTAREALNHRFFADLSQE